MSRETEHHPSETTESHPSKEGVDRNPRHVQFSHNLSAQDVSASDRFPDLRSTSLVSRTLCAASQPHLFHTVSFWWDNGHSAQRLHRLLESSPHLIPYIRQLDVPLRAAVLTELADVRFSGLREIQLGRAHNSSCPMTLAQQLISGLPLLRKLTLLGVVRPFADFGDFFHNLPSSIDALHFDASMLTGTEPTAPFHGQRLQIKELKLVHSRRLGDWLAHPSMPFEFSQLQRIEITEECTHAISHILDCARLSIAHLSMPADVIAEDQDLSRFPALNKLEITMYEENTENKRPRADPAVIREIDIAIATTPMPVLGHVEVEFTVSVSEQEVDLWQTYFPRLAGKVSWIFNIHEVKADRKRQGWGDGWRATPYPHRVRLTLIIYIRGHLEGVWSQTLVDKALSTDAVSTSGAEQRSGTDRRMGLRRGYILATPDKHIFAIITYRVLLHDSSWHNCPSAPPGKIDTEK
ncbi:hypothetical protein FB451DRAFT_1470381 [Mycena latifolia]|nr:hypothetical protein FB451DRAFT_1470381 [Mycena latifolia]